MPGENKALEKPVFSQMVRNYEREMVSDTVDSFDATIDCLDNLTRDFQKTGLLASGVEPVLVEHWYTRLASAITGWVADPATVFNIQQLAAICRRKQVLLYIFHASGYRGMAHLTWLLSTAGESSDQNLTGPKAVVLLSVLGLDDLNEQLLNVALQQPPTLFLHLTLGWLNQRTVLTERGEKNRTVLLDSGHLLSDASISDAEIPLVVNAYMYTSYASTPRKHNIKEDFNRLLSLRINDAGLTAQMPVKRHVAKPRILVIHERFRSGHAMYRSYAPLIKQLRTKFELFALVEDDHIDEAAEHLFDRVLKVKGNAPKNVEQIAASVSACEPDLILYPSLGMSHWTVMLSNLRLARIQVAAQGHPATSRSPEIDYMYISPMKGNPQDLHSERLLLGSSPVRFELHYDLPQNMPAPLRPSDREIKIAVNSKVMKLSYRLLAICKRIEKESEIPVRFRFFPGELGWFHDGITYAIKSQLPSATVAPYQLYKDFFSDVAKCDLAPSAFPFGNTNSSVDTCLLGIPTVVHFGPETPAQTDAMVLEQAGFPDWLVCKDDDAYFETAMYLINNPAERLNLTETHDAQRVREAFSDNLDGAYSRDLCDLLWHIYDNHEEILKSDTRYVDHRDI